MAVEVRIPAALRSCTGGEAVVTAEGRSVADVVGDLDQRYPGLAERLLDESGLRRFVNVYVNGEDVRFVDGLRTTVGPQDSITILPAVAGG
jgi:MoaD family protein